MIISKRSVLGLVAGGVAAAGSKARAPEFVAQQAMAYSHRGDYPPPMPVGPPSANPVRDAALKALGAKNDAERQAMEIWWENVSSLKSVSAAFRYSKMRAMTRAAQAREAAYSLAIEAIFKDHP